MTAHEHHPELIVAKLMRESALFIDIALAKRGEDVRFFSAQRGLAAQLIERAVARNLEQPRRGIFGRSAETPELQRGDERLLHNLFREPEMLRAEDARQRGDHLSRAVAEEMVDQAVDGIHCGASSSISRISIEPNSRCGES